MLDLVDIYIGALWASEICEYCLFIIKPFEYTTRNQLDVLIDRINLMCDFKRSAMNANSVEVLIGHCCMRIGI